MMAKIEMLYDATGTLLTKKQINSSGTVIETRDYIAGTEYVNAAIESIYHSEGRVFYNNGTPRYEYAIKDHLENTRLVYSDLNGDDIIDASTEILQELHYYPHGLAMNGPWMNSVTNAIPYQYNSIQKIDDFGLDVNMATFRTHDPTLGKWWSVDPASDALMALSPYNAMNNNPVLFNDPNGDIAPLLVGAAIGAGLSGITTIATNAVTGNDLFQGFGRAVAFGAIGGAISGGMSLLFADSAFGQSLSFEVLNNTISTAATNAILGQDITLGSVGGSIAGGLVGGIIPSFSGVQGGSTANVLAEFIHKSTIGGISGGIGGGVSAVIDGRDINTGIANGLKYGAISGGVQAGLNILTMGPAYIPNDVKKYGDFGNYNPVYRKGTFITNYFFEGGGITLGRNLVTNLVPGDKDYNDFLRAHETGHYVQEIMLGYGKMYARTLKGYIKHGQIYSYFKPGTLEFGANMYSMHRIGYYYLPNGVRRSFK